MGPAREKDHGEQNDGDNKLIKRDEDEDEPAGGTVQRRSVHEDSKTCGEGGNDEYGQGSAPGWSESGREQQDCIWGKCPDGGAIGERRDAAASVSECSNRDHSTDTENSLRGSLRLLRLHWHRSQDVRSDA